MKGIRHTAEQIIRKLKTAEQLIADTGIDKMSVEKLRELQKVLGMLEKLKD